MSNCPVELTEWISDRELLDLIRQADVQFSGSAENISLYINTTEEQLELILQHSYALSELGKYVTEIHFLVEGVKCATFFPKSLAVFQMEQAQYYHFQYYSCVEIPEFNTPTALIDYTNGATIMANQLLADLFGTTVEELEGNNLLQYWEQGLEELVVSLCKYGKVQQLPCCIRLGVQPISTWVVVNAFLLEHQEHSFVCLIEIIGKPVLHVGAVS